MQNVFSPLVGKSRIDSLSIASPETWLIKCSKGQNNMPWGIMGAAGPQSEALSFSLNLTESLMYQGIPRGSSVLLTDVIRKLLACVPGR